MLHGEAVAIGIHMAAVMSQKLGWVDGHLVDQIVQLLKFYNVRGTCHCFLFVYHSDFRFILATHLNSPEWLRCICVVAS